VAKDSAGRGARTRLSGAEEHRATKASPPVFLAIMLIGNFGCRLRDALSPSARTRAVPEVKDCDSVVEFLGIPRGICERRDCDGPTPGLVSVQTRRRRPRTTELTATGLFSSQHLLFGVVAHPGNATPLNREDEFEVDNWRELIDLDAG
jgi:hypothetical protein